MSSETFNLIGINLNELQNIFVTSKPNNGKLLAVPGAGKTTSIIAKILYMHETGSIKKPSEFLILTFTNATQEDMLNKGKKINKNLFIDSNIRTFHSLAGYINKHFKTNKNKSINTAVLRAYLNIQSNDTKTINFLKSLKYIFVDEAQDISENQYNLTLLIKLKFNIILYLIGDVNQNIYQFQGGSDKYLLEYDGEVFVLKENYRSNKNIIQFFNALAPHKTDITSNKNSNNLVNIIIYTKNNFTQKLIENIKQHKGNFSDLTIIAPTKKNSMNTGLNNVINILKDNKIDCNICYNLHSNNTNHKIKNNVKDVNKVDLHTIHSSKGLEYKTVLLLNFHFETMNCVPTEEEYNNHKYLWYVGCSRAKDNMTIFCNKTSTVFPLLSQISQDCYIIDSNIELNTKYYFKNNKKEEIRNVTKIIEKMDDNKQYIVENSIKTTYNKKDIYEPSNIPVFNEVFIGLFLENIIECFYNETNYYNKTYYRYLYRLNLPDTEQQKFNIFFEKYNINKYQIDIPELSESKKSFTQNEFELYKILYEHYNVLILNNNKITTFSVNFDNTTLINKLMDICKYPSDDYVSNVFNIVKIQYICEHKLYYLEKEWTEDKLKYVKDIITKIEKYMLDTYMLHKTLKFQTSLYHNNIGIIGRPDIINKDNNQIIEIKCCSEINFMHMFQLYFYKSMYSKYNKLTIWNVLKGELYDITFELTTSKLDFLLNIQNLTNLKLKNFNLFYNIDYNDECKLNLYDHNYNKILSCNKYNLENFKTFLNKFSKCCLITTVNNEKIFTETLKNKIIHSGVEHLYIEHDYEVLNINESQLKSFINLCNNIIDNEYIIDNNNTENIIDNNDTEDIVDNNAIINNNNNVDSEDIFNNVNNFSKKDIIVITKYEPKNNKLIVKINNVTTEFEYKKGDKKELKVIVALKQYIENHIDKYLIFKIKGCVALVKEYAKIKEYVPLIDTIDNIPKPTLILFEPILTYCHKIDITYY